MSGEGTITLKHGGEERLFSLHINRRRSARNFVMRLGGKGVVKVSAPPRASVAEISAFVEKHSSWIFEESQRLEPRKSLSEHLAASPFVYCCGMKLNAGFISTSSKGYWIEDLRRGEIIFASKDDASLRRLFIEYAKNAIGRTLAAVSASRGLNAEKYCVRNQRSRWASRSSTGMLSFNWRMVLLEPEYQEYIILHELAHERFMDHSVSFWIHLSRLCENARAVDRRLTKNASKIFQVEI